MSRYSRMASAAAARSGTESHNVPSKSKAAAWIFIVGIFCFLNYQRSRQKNEEKELQKEYQHLYSYTGQSEIDSYEFIEDGTGVAIHWSSVTKKEDSLAKKYRESYTKINPSKEFSNGQYIIRENQKLSASPESKKIFSKDYWTLTIYKKASKQLIR